MKNLIQIQKEHGKGSDVFFLKTIFFFAQMYELNSRNTERLLRGTIEEVHKNLSLDSSYRIEVLKKNQRNSGELPTLISPKI